MKTAKEIADDHYEKHLERTKNWRDMKPQELHDSYKQYTEALDKRGIIPTLAGHRFKHEIEAERKKRKASQHDEQPETPPVGHVTPERAEQFIAESPFQFRRRR